MAMNALCSPESERTALDNIPLGALRQPARKCICDLLNATKLIPTEDGILRDWRGLSYLTAVLTVPPCSKNPTGDVLNAWERSASSENPATLGQLQRFFGQIDRWDAYDDTKEMFEKDAEQYLKAVNTPAIPSRISERDIITVGDMNRRSQGLPLETYHAFLLHADEDTAFANEIVTTLEGKYDMKICLRERDLLVGHQFEHDAIMRLIAYRCERLIVIFSKHFVESNVHSNVHQFFCKFAQFLSIDEDSRKIVPCAYTREDIPKEFRFYFVLVQKGMTMDSFCSRLRDALQLMPALSLAAPSISITDSQEQLTQRCTIEEISSEPMRRSSSRSSHILESSAEADVETQVVEMTSPSALLSPSAGKTKCVQEPQTQPLPQSEPQPEPQPATEGSTTFVDRVGGLGRVRFDKIKKFFVKRNSNDDAKVKTKKKTKKKAAMAETC